MRLPRTAPRLLAAAAAFLATIELALRVASYTDDSRLYLFGTYPVSLTPTLGDWERRMGDFLRSEREELHYARYDSLLGWSYRPNRASADALYRFDSLGMRVHGPPHACASEACLHILLSGNSLMMSAEVPGERSLAFLLEQALEQAGVPCHVYNGAAGNYSTDQAYLQWRHVGRRRRIDWVLLGFNPRHALGNATIFPFCSFPETKIYYTKPRAYWEQGRLAWANLPTLPPERILDDIVVGFEQSPLYRFEHARAAARLHEGLRWEPYLWAVARRNWDVRTSTTATDQAEAMAVTWALLGKFAKEVALDGGRLAVVETPVFDDVWQAALLGKRGLAFPDTLGVPAVGTLGALMECPGLAGGFMPGLSHYDRHGNLALAQAIADWLLAQPNGPSGVAESNGSPPNARP